MSELTLQSLDDFEEASLARVCLYEVRSTVTSQGRAGGCRALDGLIIQLGKLHEGWGVDHSPNFLSFGVCILWLRVVASSNDSGMSPISELFYTSSWSKTAVFPPLKPGRSVRQFPLRGIGLRSNGVAEILDAILVPYSSAIGVPERFFPDISLATTD